MKPEPFVVTPETYTEPLNVIGVKITALATANQTQGYEITLQEGIGPPPHYHDWDESFFILEGSVNLTCGNQAVSCGPGSLIHVSGGTVHSFQFGRGWKDAGDYLQRRECH